MDKDLIKALEDITLIKNENDVYKIFLDLFNCFESIDKFLVKNSNFYVYVLNAVFRNEEFNKRLLSVLKADSLFISENSQREKDKLIGKELKDALEKIEVENKRFIHSCLILATYPIYFSVSFLTNENVVFIKKTVANCLFYIREFQKNEFSTQKIVFSLEEIIYNKIFSRKIYVLPEKKDSFLLSNKSSRFICVLVLMSSGKLPSLIDKFKEINKKRSKVGVSVISLNRLEDFFYNYDYKFNYVLNNYLTNEEKRPLVNFLGGLLEKNKENIFSFIRIFVSGFCGIDIDEKIHNGLSVSKNRRDELIKIARTDLKAFYGSVSGVDVEWSNKIYIICQKVLGVFEGVFDAKDIFWRKKVFNRELFVWFDEIYGILNKFELIDDWDEIEKYTREENDQTEWKSTFLTPIESVEGLTVSQMREFGKKLFDGLVETIIAMMNTKGGQIIIGLVERPENIKREEFKSCLLLKDQKTFFDVGFDLKFNSTNFDGIKRLLQEKLKSQTGLSEDYFNDLWSMEPLILKNGEKSFEIYKINLNKSPRPIFHTKNLWVSLARRANGKTIFVDPRVYLEAID